jgi:hypothetical protein
LMKLEESSGSANAEFAMTQNSIVQDVFSALSSRKLRIFRN